jgi:hypothetical protein
MKGPRAARLLREIVGNRIFGATFRRADGSLRSGTFRLGVRKGLSGAGLSYDPGKRGNVIVWDMRLGGYRTIKLNRLVSLRCRGREEAVRQEDVE